MVVSVSDQPAFSEVADVDIASIRGLLQEHGDPTWSSTYEHSWEKHRETWKAVRAALLAASSGKRPTSPSSKSPSWLMPLVGERIKTLGSRWQQGGGFEEVRTLERLGLVSLEPDDRYVLALVGGLGDRWNEVSRSEQLKSDPDLLDRLWRVFEVEGGGEISLANIDKFSRPDASWQMTFLELLDDGTIDRRRVLLCCLEALQRDFSAYRAGWFSALHNRLEPTLDERASLQSKYRSLLRSDVTATVSMAAKRLRELSAAGLLDDSEYAELEPALVARTEGASLDVLRILADIAGRQPQLRDAVVVVIATGLDHPQADVQRAATKLLAKLGAEGVAQDAAPSLAPSVQRQLGKRSEGPQQEVRSVRTETPSALAALHDAELIERMSGLLEDASDPIEVELVLAALASLDDPSRLHPLSKRAQQVLKRGPREGVTPGWLRGHLARLVLIAGGEKPPPLPAVAPRVDFLARRMAHVEHVLAGKSRPTVLLATPSLTSGLLESSVLLRRLQSLPTRPPNEDFIAALLRLDTDGRSQALAQVRGEDEVSQVLRHALGAPPPKPSSRFRRGVKLGTPSLWVAASRVRAPFEDDELLLQAGLSHAGQGRPVRASLQAQSRNVTWKDNRGEHTSVHWDWSIHVADGANAGQELEPTVAGKSRDRASGHDLEDWVQWAFATTPHDVEPVLAELLPPVLAGIDGSEVRHDATRILVALGNQTGSLGFLGQIALAAGLGAHRPDHRVLAIDAVLSHAIEGRLNPTCLAVGMVAVASAVPPARWATSLTTLAQERGDAFVFELLGHLLPGVPADLRGLHVLIELFYEEAVRLNCRVEEHLLRAWLTSVTGNGRSPKAARQLLAL